MSGRPAKQQAKVTRYRAGFLPTHAKDQVDESEAALENKKSLSFGPRRDELSKAKHDQPRGRGHPRAARDSPSPPRQRSRSDHEKQTNSSPADPTEDDEVHIPRRNRVTPQLLDVDNGDKIVGLSDDEESDDEAMQRRRRIRAQMAEMDDDEENHNQAQTLKDKYSSHPDQMSDEESSEWETDSDAEEEEFNAYKDRLRAHAPVFVGKEKRVTVTTEEDETAAAEKEEQEKLEKQEQRKEETKSFLQDAVVSVADESNHGNELSDEEGDPKEEYEKWKQREIARIVKEYQVRHPECMDEENQSSKKKDRSKEGNKLRYMQKYYHKGAFYQDEELLQRDYTAPTLEDKMDITLLPKVMQVKNFGKSSRSKYTHLADVDTTDRSAGWTESRKRSSPLNSTQDPAPKRRK